MSGGNGKSGEVRYLRVDGVNGAHHHIEEMIRDGAVGFAIFAFQPHEKDIGMHWELRTGGIVPSAELVHAMESVKARFLDSVHDESDE